MFYFVLFSVQSVGWGEEKGARAAAAAVAAAAATDDDAATAAYIRERSARCTVIN
jgi:hypothetical protein